MSEVQKSNNADASAQAFSIKTRKPLDEEDLLTDEDKVKKVVTAKDGEDCTTRRRACKNCTCGRAQQEKNQEAEEGGKKDENWQPPVGGCGNCAKGDAFRCATCPNLGKPAWNTAEPGGTVQVQLQDDF